MVECTALEMRHTRKGIGGSNPSLSAIFALRAAATPTLRAGSEFELAFALSASFPSFRKRRFDLEIDRAGGLDRPAPVFADAARSRDTPRQSPDDMSFATMPPALAGADV